MIRAQIQHSFNKLVQDSLLVIHIKRVISKVFAYKVDTLQDFLKSFNSNLNFYFLLSSCSCSFLSKTTNSAITVILASSSKVFTRCNSMLLQKRSVLTKTIPPSLICIMIQQGKGVPEIMISLGVTKDEIYEAIKYGLNIGKYFTADEVQHLIIELTPDISFKIMDELWDLNSEEGLSETAGIMNAIPDAASTDVGEVASTISWTTIIIVGGSAIVILVGLYFYWKKRKKTPPTDGGIGAESSPSPLQVDQTASQNTLSSTLKLVMNAILIISLIILVDCFVISDSTCITWVFNASNSTLYTTFEMIRTSC
jgi:hypothetical protein